DAAQHPFLYTSNGMTDLGTLTGGSYSSARAINDGCQVIGEADTTNSEIHGFVFRDGTLLDLGTLGGTYSSAYAINNSGQVIGDSLTANDAEFHAFLYQSGTMLDLGTLGGNFSSAAAINNLGQVVGNSEDANHVAAPFLWQNGVIVDLNTFLAPDSGWQLSYASMINDLSQVVGYGSYNGNFAWYLLSIKAANHPPVADAGPSQT